MRQAQLALFVTIAMATSCLPIDPMPPDQPCLEAGYAIASRTLECTGNAKLSQDRYDAFRKEFTCIEWDVTDPRLGLDFGAQDLFGCAFVLSNLPCELVDEKGDDIEAWLLSTDTCALVVEMEGVDTSHLLSDPDTGGGQ